MCLEMCPFTSHAPLFLVDTLLQALGTGKCLRFQANYLNTLKRHPILPSASFALLIHGQRSCPAPTFVSSAASSALPTFLAACPSLPTRPHCVGILHQLFPWPLPPMRPCLFSLILFPSTPFLNVCAPPFPLSCFSTTHDSSTPLPASMSP